MLRYQGRLCVPDVDGLRDQILEEAYATRYSIHPGLTKTYHDLREIYLLKGLKRDIAEFVTKCPNFQKVKVNTKSWVSCYKRSKFLLGCGNTSIWTL